ncbi:MAG: hypothetical protein Q7T71_17425 [Herbiconiux sp.]|nr:hypothetical protein [Herbiconiux sp.]
MARRRDRGPRWLATGKPVDEPEPMAPRDIDAAVADGLLIARFSAVLALKNRLIVSALRDDLPFEPERAAREAREVLAELAAEQDHNSEHARDVIGLAELSRGAARHEHDYKRRDVELLTARRTVYRAVAEGIRSDADDPAVLDTLVEDARGRAWDEISRELGARLDDAGRVANMVVDDEYRRTRDERMRRLREFDLWELADRTYRPARA